MDMNIPIADAPCVKAYFRDERLYQTLVNER